MSTTPVVDIDRTIPSADDELWYTRCPVPTAFEVALARGEFDAALRGKGVEWIPLAASDNPAVHQSHFTHCKENSFRHGGNVPAIVARARGAETRVIGASWLPVAYTVQALPQSGIASPADLRGRRLLVPRRPRAAVDFWAASTLRVYAVALASAGLTFDDVELVDVEAEADLIPAAAHATPRDRLRWTLDNAYTIQRSIIGPLVRGEVDAVTSQATLSEQLRVLTGARVVFDQADQPVLADRVNNGYPDVVTVSAGLLERDPDLVVSVLVAPLRATDWAGANAPESEALLSDRIQISSALLRATYGDLIGTQLDVTLPPETADVLRLSQQHLLDHGFIDEPFDVESWIDPEPLRRAREIVAGGGR